MKSYLTDDMGWPRGAAEAVEIKVGPGGEILGTGKYQDLDPLWELVAGAVWLENLLHKHPFPGLCLRSIGGLLAEYRQGIL